MDSDIDFEAQNEFAGAHAASLRNACLQSILEQPFAGQVTILLEEEALHRANQEYDVLDLTNKLVFWTDASKIKERVVGIAVVWRPVHYSERWEHKMFCLDKDFTNQHGEFFAIAAAIKIAIKVVRGSMGSEESRVSSIIIYSDSQTALTKIRDFHILGESQRSYFDRHVELARLKEKAKNLVDMGVPLELVWVKGHKRVRGNVLADRLAARATQGGTGVEEILPTSRSYLDGSLQQLGEAQRKERREKKERMLLEKRRKRKRIKEKKWEDKRNRERRYDRHNEQRIEQRIERTERTAVSSLPHMTTRPTTSSNRALLNLGISAIATLSLVGIAKLAS